NRTCRHGDRRREHDVPRLRQLERREPFAYALGKRVAAEKKERNVGAERKRHRREPLPGQTEPPQPVQDGERGGAIGAASAESPAYRYVFFDVDFDALSRRRLGLQQPPGADGELLVLLDPPQRPSDPNR